MSLSYLLLATLLSFLFLGVQAKDQLSPPPPAFDQYGKEPNYDCPEGYYLDGALCVMTIEERPQARCSWGKLEGDTCVKEIPAEADCPPNFVLIEPRYESYRHHQQVKSKTPVQQEAKCLRTVTAPPVPKCPEGYILAGVKCHTTNYVDPVCPAGTVEISVDECAYYKPSNKRCPPGFSPGAYRKGLYKEEKCSRVNFAEPMATCKNEYTLSPDSSVCEKVTVLPQVCSHGTVDVGDQCALYKPVEKRCPAGYSSNGRKHTGGGGCVKVTAADAYAVCRDGYSLDAVSGKCLKITMLPPVCPYPSKEVDGKCIAYTTADPQCPTDFAMSRRNHKQSNPICVKTVQTDANPVCGDGFSLEDGEQCVKMVSNPLVCPHGTQEVDDNSCVVYDGAGSECPPGFERGPSDFFSPKNWHGKNAHKRNNGESCVQVQTLEALPSCTKDFTLSIDNDPCEKILSLPPTPVCNKGARQGNDCVEYKPVQPVYDCPDGYQQRGHRCAQIVDYDCSTVEYETKCRNEPDPCVGKECEKDYVNQKRRLKIDEYDRDEGKRRVHMHSKSLKHKSKRAHSKSDVICEKVAVSETKMCQKELYADAMLSCPSGSQPQGKGCVVPEFFMLDLVCPDGLVLEGTRCVKTLRKTAVYSCGDGFELSELAPGSQLFTQKHYAAAPQKSCVRTLSADVTYFCDDGVLEGQRCAKYFTKVCRNGECERRVATLPDFQCPFNFSPLYKGREYKSRRAPICVARESVPVSYFCEEGELDEGNTRCVQAYSRECPPGGCERKSEISPQYECPDGFRNAQFKGKHGSGNDSCTAIETADYEYFCSKGESVFEGHQCAKYVPKECPGGDCYRTSSQPISLECPIEFQLQRKHNFVHAEFSHKGKEEDAVCTSREYMDFEPFCSKGGQLVKGNDRCATYVTKACPNGQCEEEFTVEPTFVCPAGFDMPPTFPHKGKSRNTVTLCQAKEYVDPVYRCEKGMTNPAGTMCLKTTAPDYDCFTHGATLTPNGVCVVTDYKNPNEFTGKMGHKSKTYHRTL